MIFYEIFHASVTSIFLRDDNLMRNQMQFINSADFIPMNRNNERQPKKKQKKMKKERKHYNSN